MNNSADRSNRTCLLIFEMTIPENFGWVKSVDIDARRDRASRLRFWWAIVPATIMWAICGQSSNKKFGEFF